MKWFIVLLALTSPAAADPLELLTGARTVLPNQPRLVKFAEGEQPCGMGRGSNEYIGFCASLRAIYYRNDFATRPQAAYEMAHVMGHYYQVRYGVADVALREIRNRRDEEVALRALVTQQVECVAGVLMSRAGLAFVPLDQMYASEPFTDAHWGAQPLRAGPKVSIGMPLRAAAYANGYRSSDIAACGYGEMTADILVNAQN